MADFGDEILENVQSKLNTALEKANASSSKGMDDDDSKSFGMFDNSFISNSAAPHISSTHTCKYVLYIPICQGTTVRAWDVLLFLPCLTFLLFLAIRWSSTKRKLLATHSPIFRTFHFLVALNTLVILVRGIGAMIATGTMEAKDAQIADKVLWVLSFSSLIVMEISVLIFGIAGAQLDNMKSIVRVFILAMSLTVMFTLCLSILEFSKPDESFLVHPKVSGPFDLFGYGGSAFLFASSLCFSLLYLLVIIAPFIPAVQRQAGLPDKPSFYQYCLCLFIIHMLHAIGAGLIHFQGSPSGLCLINLATFLYLTSFIPLVYSTFIQPFFKTSQPTLLFSYKAQVDDGEEEGIQHSGSLQFSLSPGSGDPVNNGDDSQESQPIVRGGAQAAIPVLIEGLASPDSVENVPNVKY